MKYFGSGEHELWCTVLLTMVHDLTHPAMKLSRDRELAEAWVGLYPSRDFKIVCSLAGLDYEAVFDQLRAICKTEFEERRWQGGWQGDQTPHAHKKRRAA